jgi:hypothetical protein
MICTFCKRDFPKLIKAHIIPRSFFKDVRGESKYTVLIHASEKGTKKDFKQAGIYDSDILCEACEAIFSKYDSHGYRVFSEVFKRQQIYYDAQGIPCALLFQNLEYKLFKLFVLGMLWRASVSCLSFFYNVKLGPHEDIINRMIAEGDPGGLEDYPFCCITPLGQAHPHLILPPWRSRSPEVSFYRFYLPDVIILIKVDQRPFPAHFHELIVKPNPPHYLAILPHHDSAEYKYIEKAKRVMRQRLKS